jgi:hypothetical protein
VPIRIVRRCNPVKELDYTVVKKAGDLKVENCCPCCCCCTVGSINLIANFQSGDYYPGEVADFLLTVDNNSARFVKEIKTSFKLSVFLKDSQTRTQVKHKEFKNNSVKVSVGRNKKLRNVKIKLDPIDALTEPTSVRLGIIKARYYVKIKLVVGGCLTNNLTSEIELRVGCKPPPQQFHQNVMPNARMRIASNQMPQP